ncbi:branched-chain amino acid ABC transporter permease [Bacillota bacterium Meth-B3]|nr:branched-chain amino acid ABC transporter permease [Christensenellaceae bacterium]MEA5066226.1 branched-chain amino acid ABC transporter permease [Eubacteriales bacterium]MEA5068285.1 branched-chain amino acid ABC transporter permease [Christensenellaceae bacterium]
MQLFLQNLIGGLQMGSIYALIALGYTMVYGIVRLINFAHGDIMMVGAYAVYWLLSLPFMAALGTDNPTLSGAVAVAFAVAVCVALGVLVDRIAYKPLRNAPRISALITAIGISLALQIIAQLVFGSGQLAFPPIVPKIALFKVGRKPVYLLEVLTLAVSIVLMIALSLFVKNTRTGKAMRAVSEDKGAAQLMGINVDNTISITFAIGCALAAIGAVFYAQKVVYIKPLLGSMPGLKAFVAAVLGGIGIIPGAVLGGFIIGIAETFIKYYAGEYVDAMVFGILILVLLLKPSGMLGKKAKEKV